MEQMVDVTIDGEWFATLRVAIGDDERRGENAYVAKVQSDLAKRGYVLDNEVTYCVRDPAAGEPERFASDIEEFPASS